MSKQSDCPSKTLFFVPFLGRYCEILRSYGAKDKLVYDKLSRQTIRVYEDAAIEQLAFGFDVTGGDKWGGK